jgi:hypothetical protein
VNQALQPVGRNIQCRVVHRALVTRGGFGALRFENIVNLVLDIRQLGLGSSLANPAAKRIERIQWACIGGTPEPQEFPGCGKRGREAAQHHWCQIDPVAVFIHEALLGAVVDGRSSGMQRQIGILVGAGRSDLREEGLFPHQVPAHAHDRLRQRGDQIGSELFLRNEI